MMNELNRDLGAAGERLLTAYETETRVGITIGAAIAALGQWLAARLGAISAATRRVGPAV